MLSVIAHFYACTGLRCMTFTLTVIYCYDSCGSPELQVLARFPCGIVPRRGKGVWAVMGGWRDRQAEEMYGRVMTNVPQLSVG